MFYFSVNAVIPRFFPPGYMERTRPRYISPAYLEKARIVSPFQKKNHFKPSASRCCKVGEKTARKRLSCNMDMYTKAKNNRPAFLYMERAMRAPQSSRQMTKALLEKISKCSKQYTKHYEKCCRYRAEFFKELKLCKKTYRRRLARRQCKKDVRSKYP